ncbi:hypothetical protein I3842_09G090400 [Carya illinoinensis]|uniref:Uncharacterized protein n=1 Tax=Carya illinoinensis TaxID=32201 RepID=A0A922E368_CARIL|nr:hypothetical protein I3842_09G090400 [Carya illinoinensis]
MAFFLSTFFGCFSTDSGSRVACSDVQAGEEWTHGKASNKTKVLKKAKSNKNQSSKRSSPPSPPIIVSHFPVGTRLSHL